MTNIELVKAFCEEQFEEFQLWLEDVHEVEGSEAEVILAQLEEKQ